MFEYWMKIYIVKPVYKGHCGLLWAVDLYIQVKIICIIHIHVNLPAGAFFSQFWGSLPSTFKIFRPWKKSSTIKSWPTFCDQYFWKFPIWNSRAKEKWEIRMVKVNVIFNDIWLLTCLTPLQVNWVMVIN